MISYNGGTTGVASGSISDYYSRFKIFIDASQNLTINSHQNYGYSGNITGQNLRVGQWNNGQNLRNNTRVDELAIWDSDESSNTLTIYNSGNALDLSTLTTEPKHWWRMGDGDSYPYLLDSGTEANCTFVMTNMTSADIVNDVP